MPGIGPICTVGREPGAESLGRGDATHANLPSTASQVEPKSEGSERSPTSNPPFLHDCSLIDQWSAENES